jgi:spermidine/putrescine transport system permease protein
MTRWLSFRNVSVVLVVSWIVLFVFLPTLLVAVTSFLTRDARHFVSFVPTLENYRSLLEPVYFSMLTRSLGYSLFSTLACLAVGYPFAWLISRAGRRVRPMLLLLVIIPFWTSSLIRTYALIILFKANGLVNTLLLALGLTRQPLEILYTDLAVYIGLVYTLLPFMVLPLYATLEKIDQRLIEAAVDLGAGPVQVFTRVVIPLSVPGIVAGCTMVFLPSMGLFYIPDLLGGAKNMLIGNFIKNQFLTAGNWPFGSSASVLLSVMMLGLIVFYFRSMKHSTLQPVDQAQ